MSCPRLQSDTDHLPTMKDGRRICGRCHKPYRYDSQTGTWRKEPYGPCPGLKQTRLQRNKGLNQVSPDRDRKRADRGLDTELAEWVRDQPCMLSGHPAHECQGDVVAHHVRHKAHEGDWRELPSGKVVGNVVAICWFGHERLHKIGRVTFERSYSVDLEHLAREYGERAPVEAGE